MKKRRKEVAILTAAGWGNQAALIDGIRTYVREIDAWHIIITPETNVTPGYLKGWKGDGIIGEIRTRGELKLVKSIAGATVNISGKLPPGLLPRVMTDNAGIGQLAAEHLIERYFKRFALVVRRDTYDDSERRRGFAERLKQDGFTASTFQVPSLFNNWRAWAHVEERIDAFLRKLEKPVAVFVGDDMRANMVLNACRRLQLDVPDDVAVIGVDNNTHICEVSLPPLSSIERAQFETGYQAAKLLDRLMHGEVLPAEDHLLPPHTVVQRRSTEVLAIEDPDVKTIVNYVRDHIREAFGAMEMIEMVPVARRTILRRFKQELGSTIYEYICQERIRRAEHYLLHRPDMQIQEIADFCGFSSAKHLRNMLHKNRGVSPTAVRRNSRNGMP